MLAVFFCITTVICGLGWFFNRQSLKAIAKLLKEDGYQLPSDERLKACSKSTLKETLHIKR